MIQESRPEELVDLHLVPGRHRSRRRRLGDDLRRRHPRLLHERRRQQGEGQPRLRALRRQPGCRGADAERLDLVAGHVQLLASRRTPPGTSCSGPPGPSTTCSAPARWTSSTRSAPRSGRTRTSATASTSPIRATSTSIDVSAPGAKIYFTAQPLFFDLTTEWAANAAEDGGQGSPGRRRPGQAGGGASTRKLKEAGLG